MNNEMERNEQEKGQNRAMTSRTENGYCYFFAQPAMSRADRHSSFRLNKYNDNQLLPIPGFYLFTAPVVYLGLSVGGNSILFKCTFTTVLITQSSFVSPGHIVSCEEQRDD